MEIHIRVRLMLLLEQRNAVPERPRTEMLSFPFLSIKYRGQSSLYFIEDQEKLAMETYFEILPLTGMGDQHLKLMDIVSMFGSWQ